MKAELHLPTWREMNMDTSPEAEALLFELLRATPAWRKLELLESLNRTARELAIIGLRRRYPGATEVELHRRLADMILGEELAAKAYGPPMNDSGAISWAFCERSAPPLTRIT